MSYSDSLLDSESPSRSQSLAEHERLSALYVNDRFSFEMERKNLIETFMKMVPCPRMRSNLEELQLELDRVLKGAGSAHNRFLMMQMFFWDRVNNHFIPALNALSQNSDTGISKKKGMESSEPSKSPCKPRLRLLKSREG